MPHAHAFGRYVSGMVGASGLVLAGSFGVSWFSDASGLPSWVPIVASAVPVGALLAMFWIQARYVLGLDEYVRLVHGKALLVATAATLGSATAWGYLEIAAGLAALPVYWLNPLFWIIYAIMVSALSWRDAASRS